MRSGRVYARNITYFYTEGGKLSAKPSVSSQGEKVRCVSIDSKGGKIM